VGFGRNVRKVLLFFGDSAGIRCSARVKSDRRSANPGPRTTILLLLLFMGSKPPKPPRPRCARKSPPLALPYQKGPPPRQWPPEGQRSVTHAVFNIIYIVSTVLRWMACELWPPMAKGGRASGWKRRPGLGTSQDRTEESTTVQSSACAKKSQFSNEALFRRRSLPPRSWWYSSSTVRTS
jgi:hypothetical protein